MNRADDVFEALVAAHEGLDDEASRLVNARLILLLAEEVGDTARVLDLIREAARVGRSPSGGRPCQRLPTGRAGARRRRAPARARRL